MEKIIVVEGGHPLHGNVRINGSKNAALPIMAACILMKGKSRIRNVPHLADVKTLLEILKDLGVKTERLKDDTLELEVIDESNVTAPYEQISKMRGSICILGPLLGKRKRVKIAEPGGCVIGVRPVDLHIKGMEALGANIIKEEGYRIGSTNGFRGAEIYLGGPYGSTVTGTCNVMMAATLAKGKTIVRCAACEPEVQDLANFLNKAGAKISGIGTSELVIEGVEELHGIEYEIIPDRIEAGTFMIAGAITGGEITLENVCLDHLTAVIEKLAEAGASVSFASGETGGKCFVKGSDKFRPLTITTLPYPDIPTDMQAQFLALLSIANGTSIITEKIFPNRFIHVAELNRMGADILIEGTRAIVKGVRKLSGARVMASDLRASACLVIAGLVAEGTTEIRRPYHLDRGYEKLEQRLSALGAKINRVTE
ncbi:MAG: UDP-N-acetylglucosamine 1-carboxyvinyltransferase [Candidatus Brocadiales bacterium]